MNEFFIFELRGEVHPSYRPGGSQVSCSLRANRRIRYFPALFLRLALPRTFSSPFSNWLSMSISL
jgi:hypothetical protein